MGTRWRCLECRCWMFGAGCSSSANTQHPAPQLLHIDAARARLLLRRLRKTDLEYPVAERCVAGAGVDVVGQGNRAVEASIAPLAAIETFLLVLDVAVALAANDERILIDLDIHVIAREARKIRADDEIVAALEDLDLWRPQSTLCDWREPLL